MSSYLLSISATYFDLILIIKHGVHPTGDLGHLSESYETILSIFLFFTITPFLPAFYFCTTLNMFQVMFVV